MEKVKERWVTTEPSPEDASRVAEMLASVRARASRSLAASDREAFDRLSPEEQRAKRLADFDRLWKELAAITDETDTEESWAEFERNIDEERRSAGMRTIFEGRR